jgi:predicted SnoaL-like aldol condensation-catalyzing enzyme
MDGKELVRRIFDEIVNAGNLDAADELMADDYVDHGPMGDIPGREAFKHLVGQYRAAISDLHCEVSNVIMEGDLVAWLVHTTGTHTGDQLGFPATGKSFETVSANMGRIRDDQATEHWAEQGMFPMLVQLGVIPPPGG